MSNAINIEDLIREAVKYNPVLRALPFDTFLTAAAILKINLLEVKNKDVINTFLRKGGLIKPYDQNNVKNHGEIGKVKEMELEPKLVYLKLIDNIQNYKQKNVLSNAGEPVDNVSKKHPLERIILETIVNTFSEDVVLAMFHGERDTSNPTAMTAFNGFYTKLNEFVTAGEIAAAKNNLVTTGAFTDTDAYDKLVAFMNEANPMLKRDNVVLYHTNSLITKVRKSFREKTKNYGYPTMQEIIQSLRDDVGIPNLELLTHENLGTGDNIILTKGGNLDFGVDTTAAANFVKVKESEDDPNNIIFWIQAGFDTRIQNLHPKMFLTNEQVNSSSMIAGDY